MLLIGHLQYRIHSRYTVYTKLKPRASYNLRPIAETPLFRLAVSTVKFVFFVRFSVTVGATCCYHYCYVVHEFLFKTIIANNILG